LNNELKISWTWF